MTRKDALEILGLEADASIDEAKRAYRNLSLHYHPDRNPAPNASTMFRYIHDAWEYIQNDAKQKKTSSRAGQETGEGNGGLKQKTLYNRRGQNGRGQNRRRQNGGLEM